MSIRVDIDVAQDSCDCTDCVWSEFVNIQAGPFYMCLNPDWAGPIEDPTEPPCLCTSHFRRLI
jgi:hypothetical protein